MNPCFIAIDTGGTKIAGAVLDEAGKSYAEETVFLKGTGGKDAAVLLYGLTRKLLKSAAEQKIEIKAAGVCVPGIAYHQSGEVWAPNIPGWERYPLHRELQEVLGADIPVHIDSDRACSILAETWLGAAKGCSDAIFVAVGTGIGAGIMADGHIIRGHADIAGATGWMALQPPYDRKFDACGCFEYYASGNGIVRTAEEFLSVEKNYNGALKRGKFKAYDVFTAYDKNDPVALKTFDKVIMFWGMALANYVSLFNPEKVIFGGGVFGPAVQFIPRIVKEAEKWAQPIGITQVSIEASKIGPRAGLLGAGRLAMLTTMKEG
ncbi:MAG: ROK family protein [Candidatus Marinimicrobia bacterium]|jgi:glucokinase|nr:ROK family protein [Candidatus Neomarinimicrobiota bacterium]MDX9778386.1 ROK family protein [bacterium]